MILFTAIIDYKMIALSFSPLKINDYCELSLVVALKYFHMNGLPDLFFMMRVMVAGLVSPQENTQLVQGVVPC